VRVAAYLVDWLVAVILASVLVTIGGLQLYIASDWGKQEPPDPAVYAFLLLSVLALPIWLLATYAGWSMSGRSVGKLAVGLRIVQQHGAAAGPLRSLVRLAVYGVENAPLLLLPAILILTRVSDDALPGWWTPVAAAMLLAALAAQAPALLSPGGRALHDLAAGTVVVEE